MEGTIQNRDQFLNKIAGRLLRPRISTTIQRPRWKHRPQDEVMKNATQDELVEALKEAMQYISIRTFIRRINMDLAAMLDKVVAELWGWPIITWKDQRFGEWGSRLTYLKKIPPSKSMNVYEWRL